MLQAAASGAEDNYYNLQVQGFRDGQLNVQREPPPGLAKLADPYDPVANASYRLNASYWLHDLSYYKGKLYLYCGVTPALVLFWPCVALTGHYLSHKDAVVLFISVGFLSSVGLLWALWRRYFAEVSFGVVAAGALALGFANFAPGLLGRCDAYEVAISSGYAFTMLALLGIWCALHQPRHQSLWLAGASLAYGLALGARPSLLFGAVILLIPVVQTWERKQPVWLPALAATGPIALIGLGLLLFNYLRFHNWLEFGQHYQLTTFRQRSMEQFSLRYLWLNFRVGFLEPARWSLNFPFVEERIRPSFPRGYTEVENSYGILTSIPLVWLALAAPLAWRNRSAVAQATLRWWLTAVALLFGTCAAILCLHNSMCVRYEIEFAAPLVLLAVLGMFSLERSLAGQPVWIRATNCAWGLLLAFSVVFNLLARNGIIAKTCVERGVILAERGRLDEGILSLNRALELNPDSAVAHLNLSAALICKGEWAEVIQHCEQTLRLKPDDFIAYNNWGYALSQQGKWEEAIPHYQMAIQLNPDYALANINLGNALFVQGKFIEAIPHYERTLQLTPEDADVQNNIGMALMNLGRSAEALPYFQKALNLATAQGNAALAETIRARLTAYQQ